MEDTIDAIKSEITSVIKAGRTYVASREHEKLVNRIKGKGMFLMSHIHLRILFLYFPDIFFGVTAMGPLKNCMTILGFQNNQIPKNAIERQIMLVLEKEKHPIMKKWNLYDYSHFLYSLHKLTHPEIDSQQEDQVPPESEIYKKIMNYIGVK